MAPKLSTTQEHVGHNSIQFISNRPTAAACKKRSITSVSAKPIRGESDGVNAKEGVVLARTDNGLEPRNDPWAPLASAFQCN